MSKHYDVAGISANAIIEDVLAKWEAEGYTIGVGQAYMFNVLKYLLRAPKKGTLGDVAKAKDYIEQYLKLYNHDVTNAFKEQEQRLHG